VTVNTAYIISIHSTDIHIVLYVVYTITIELLIIVVTQA